VRYIRPRSYRFNPRQSIALLDGVVERLSGARFTFTEQEALAEIWGTGEDIRLREDLRFWEIEGTGHFQLSNHTLANELLADRLWQGVWDGSDINCELGRLDELDSGNTFHVFCPVDPRFVEKDGEMALAACPTLQLSEHIKSPLDSLVKELLALHVEYGAPLSAMELREHLLRLKDDLDLGEGVELLESWLCWRSEWAEIARGLWLPAELVPTPVVPKRFRVWRVTGDNTGRALAEECEYIEESEGGDGVSDCVIRLPDPPIERHPDSSVSWTQVLRTVYLYEAYLPVPTGARFRYPRFIGRQGPVVISTLIYNSGREGYVWLDRHSHRFYGELLKETFEWEEAGRELQAQWRPTGLVLKLGEIDEEVREEELRHIDPQALYDLRMGRGESYRRSMVSILRESSGSLSFRELYNELSVRQGHSPSKASIRAVLAHAPEFVLTNEVWTWRETPDSLQSFRRSIILKDVATMADGPVRGLSEFAEAVANAVRKIMKK
jgi:hypothetical protein